MDDAYDFEITPAPSEEDREAILAAVDELLRREARLAQPSVWSLGGWIERRVGISDMRDHIPAGRRWALSARMPLGGRPFPGLNGRGDAK
ncbi:MAG TPA: hypothetical protein VFA34_00985 [Actinomycetota bacterium]|nr:hypothetical protein [Actinomycetota bacterium]